MNLIVRKLESEEGLNEQKLRNIDKLEDSEILRIFTVNPDLEPHERNDLIKLFRKCGQYFSADTSYMMTRPLSKDIEPISINTGDAAPITTRYYRRSPEQKKIIEGMVQDMLDAGVIQPSKSAWSSPS